MQVPQLVSMVRSVSIVLQTMSEMSSTKKSEVSRAQANAIKAMIAKSEHSLSDLAPVAEAVQHSNFLPEDKQGVIESIAEQIGMESSEFSKFQNWEHLFDLLPGSVMSSRGKPSFGTSVLEWCLKAGLRKPNELTFRALAVHLILDAEGFEKASKMEFQGKKQAIDMIKKWYRNLAAACREPVHKIHDLPRTIFDFERLHPELYALLFHHDPPAENTFNAVHVSYMLNTTSCRQSRSMMHSLLQSTRQNTFCIGRDVEVPGLRLLTPNKSRQETLRRAITFMDEDVGARQPASPFGQLALLPPPQPLHAHPAALSPLVAPEPAPPPATSTDAAGAAVQPQPLALPVGSSTTTLADLTKTILQAMSTKKEAAAKTKAEGKKDDAMTTQAEAEATTKARGKPKATAKAKPKAKAKIAAGSKAKCGETKSEEIKVKGTIMKKPSSSCNDKIVLSQESSRSQYIVRIFENGVAKSTLFSYKHEEVAAVKARVRAHIKQASNRLRLPFPVSKHL
jgi:hypothetical protein